MLSRIGRVIDNNRERIGLILIGIGIIWMLGVAGADDYNTMQHVFNSVVPLLIKAVLGLVVMGTGARILNGGE